jgi:ubiquinone/menaquinone biosynthesis C-methylase UbiE
MAITPRWGWALALLAGGSALGAQELAAPAAYTADFSGSEFGDFKYLARFLAKKGPDFPVSRRLRPEIRRYLESGQGQEVPEAMRRGITEDFNAMLSDRSLFGELSACYDPFALSLFKPKTELFLPEDRRLLRWLAALLTEEGVRDEERDEISAAAQLRSLNHLLLMGISHAHQQPDDPPDKPAVILAPARLAMLRPKRVVSYLGVRPGMIVADIGAAYGAFTFPLAEAAQAAGRIYAADPSTDAIAYLKARVESRGYKNVIPVQVKWDGVDPFYKRQAFDLVLLAETYQCLSDPVAYLDELRPSLKSETGRLCVIFAKMDPDLTELEFGDFRAVLRALAAKGPAFPVYQRLRPEIRKCLKSWQGQDVPQKMRRELTAGLNALLKDRLLFQELDKFYGRGSAAGAHDDELFFPEDARLGRWIVAQLDAEGISAKEPARLSPLATKQVHKLNRMLLARMFQLRIWPETLVPNPTLDVVKAVVLQQLAAAGYARSRENDHLLPYFHILEFKRAR